MKDVMIKEYSSTVKVGNKKYPYQAYRVKAYNYVGRVCYKFFPFNSIGLALAKRQAEETKRISIKRLNERLSSLEGIGRSTNHANGYLRGIHFSKGKNKKCNNPSISVDVEYKPNGKRKVKRSMSIKSPEVAVEVINKQLHYLIKEMGWNPNGKEVVGRAVNTKAYLIQRYNEYMQGDRK